jgi:raffinose/stachyose/melibiose transport system substrate-binding protein
VNQHKAGRLSGKGAALVALIASGSLLASACSAPGASSSTTPASSSAAAVAQTCGTDAITMKGYFETGFALPKALTDEFTKQYPNVTWDIREDQFAVITQNALRVLSDDPPDLMRLPSIQEAAKAGLLLNLDPYASAYGWDKWPASQLEQLRVNASGQRGDGTLYAQGLNYSLTGVFYNKELAAKIGMTEAPKTLAEFDALLAKAKAAGITGIAQFNGGATGGLAFPLQNLMAVYGETSPINNWVFQKTGATIDTATNLQAVQHLQSWIDAGYFASDINSLDYSAMMSRFTSGKSLFIFDGDWESGNFDKNMAGKVGFFLMPSLQEGGKQAAMSAPLTFGVSSKAAHPDCAAFFLNWVATNEKARDITVSVGGSHPMGATGAYMPTTDANTVTGATLAAGTKIATDNGGMDFIANATSSIYAKSWTPQLQKLAAGKQTPEALLTSVQADYESQIKG